MSHKCEECYWFLFANRSGSEAVKVMSLIQDQTQSLRYDEELMNLLVKKAIHGDLGLRICIEPNQRDVRSDSACDHPDSFKLRQSD